MLNNVNNKYNLVAGLEIHIMPTAINSKVFSSSAIATDEVIPNAHLAPFEYGLPGALPVLNKKFVDHAIRLGLALNCTISKSSFFENKHYRYPDVPCRQITQIEDPIAQRGKINIWRSASEQFSVLINRMHIEHDAGRTLYDVNPKYSAIDYNRCGNGLLEIVTEPCFSSMQDVVLFLETLRSIARTLKISDCNMSRGELRADLNISVHKDGEPYGTRTEVKNINSFNFLKKAGEFEFARHCAALESGEAIKQETRLYDQAKGVTIRMRGKEDALDYRYFINHDLPVIKLTDEEIALHKEHLVQLPHEICANLVNSYQIPWAAAKTISEEPQYSEFYHKIVKGFKFQKVELHQEAAKWMLGDLFGLLKQLEKELSEVNPDFIRELVELLDADIISGKIAKNILKISLESSRMPAEIAYTEGMIQISSPEIIRSAIISILSDSEEIKNDIVRYKEGKRALLGVFIKAIIDKRPNFNLKIVNQILTEILS